MEVAAPARFSRKAPRRRGRRRCRRRRQGGLAGAAARDPGAPPKPRRCPAPPGRPPQRLSASDGLGRAVAETVSVEEARAEAAARAARTAAVLTPLWRAARRWTAAVVLAAFPFLFILDRAGRFPVSPVLPGLVLLFALLLVLPILL